MNFETNSEKLFFEKMFKCTIFPLDRLLALFGPATN